MNDRRVSNSQDEYASSHERNNPLDGIVELKKMKLEICVSIRVQELALNWSEGRVFTE